LKQTVEIYSNVSYLATITGEQQSSEKLYVSDGNGSNQPHLLTVSDGAVSLELLAELRQRYFHSAQDVLSSGFGDWIARYRFSEQKYQFLVSRGIEFSENPFGEIGIGETAMEYHVGELSGTSIIEPTYEIFPSESDKGDRVVFRPALGDSLHGMAIAFVVPDIANPDNQPNLDVACLQVTEFNPDVFEDLGIDDDIDDSDFITEYEERYVEEFNADTGLPVVSESLKREFVDRILPQFMKMIRDPLTEFENRSGYIPLNLEFVGSNYGKIVPAEHERWFTAIL
jgi:hypothetical protein